MQSYIRRAHLTRTTDGSPDEAALGGSAARLGVGRVARLCGMLGHLGVNVADLAAAKAYYDELMPLVGFEEFLSAGDRLAYRPAARRPGTYLFFYPAARAGGYDRDAVGLQHIAFMVRTRSGVHEVHDLAVRRGDTILHAPQDFPQYPPPYFATFWLDPHGFKLEAVCHHDRD